MEIRRETDEQCRNHVSYPGYKEASVFQEECKKDGSLSQNRKKEWMQGVLNRGELLKNSPDAYWIQKHHIDTKLIDDEFNTKKPQFLDEEYYSACIQTPFNLEN